jgi:hypothetical protein
MTFVFWQPQMGKKRSAARAALGDNREATAFPAPPSTTQEKQFGATRDGTEGQKGLSRGNFTLQATAVVTIAGRSRNGQE